MSSASARGPLAGLKILEIAHMLAGPYCGMLLADLGAEVIKIETGAGDIARSVGDLHVGEHNIYFTSLNRNKKSVALDLTLPADRERFEALAADADALITNLRPKAIEKLGLTYEALKRLNPKLVCVALTGFGLKGPYRDNPAYDYIIQAMVGVMMLGGEPNGPPVRAGYSVVDNTGGMMAAIGLLAKVVEGRGGQVDVALYDTMISQLNYLAGEYLNGGAAPERHSGGAHSYFVPAQIFAAADGHLALFITHDGFWEIFAKAVGREDWLTDERFATVRARSNNRRLVIDEVAAELRKKSCEEWVRVLQPLGVVVASVRTLADAMECINTKARDMVVEIATPGGRIRSVGNPIKIDGMQGHFVPAPLLGEHTGAVTKGSAAVSRER